MGDPLGYAGDSLAALAGYGVGAVEMALDAAAQANPLNQFQQMANYGALGYNMATNPGATSQALWDGASTAASNWVEGWFHPYQGGKQSFGVAFFVVGAMYAAPAATGEAAVAAGSAAKTASKIAEGTRVYPEGSFSISNWSGYPAGAPKPAGPFRLLNGDEYNAARNAADNFNRGMHRADTSLAGQPIHDIHPIKFGGNPTDPLNKLPMGPQEHSALTTWWNNLQMQIEGF